MISIEQNENGDAKWNQRLVNSGLGTIYQTKEMKINYEKKGFDTIFLKFIDNKGNIVGQLFHSINPRFKNKGIKGNILRKFLSSKLICQWSYGPIIFDHDYDKEIYIALNKYIQEKNFKVSGMQHPLCTGGLFELQNTFQTKLWSTFLIDLQKPKDSIYMNIEKHNGRKNIERSRKRGVIVEEINEKSLKEYYKLYNEFKKIEHPNVHDNFESWLSWWKLLKPLGYSGFLAKKNEIPIGGLFFSYFNNYIIEGAVARSNKDASEKLYSQDLIKWKIIEWGIENNMKYYDLAGFNPNPESEKERGIMNYKKKWGGKQADYWLIQG